MFRNFAGFCLLVVLLGAGAAAGAPQTAAEEQTDWLAQAKQAEATRDFSRAADCYQHFLEAHPQDAEVYQRLGLVYYLSNRFQQAVPAFDRALKINSDQWAAALFLGISHYRLGEFTRALEPLRRASQVKPEMPEGHFWQASTLFALGQNDEAIAEAQKVPPDTPVSLEATALLVRAYRQAAESYYRRIQKLDPNSSRVHQLEAENMSWLNREQKAVDEYRKALAADPRLEGAHRMIGDFAWQQKHLEEAREEYAEELRIAPLSEMANLRMGQYWLAKADPNRAAPYLELAHKLNRDLPEASRDLGVVYLAHNDPQQAEPLLKTAARQTPDDPVVHKYLAELYKRTNRLDLSAQEQALAEKLAGTSESPPPGEK